MKPLILEPLGRTEPNDIQGWFEQGGALGLQMAWQLSATELRARLSHVRRRDGRGLLETTPVPRAIITIDPQNPVQRFITSELPAFVLEGALIWARACEEETVKLRLGADGPLLSLMKEVVAQFKKLGIAGRRSWSGVQVRLLSTDARPLREQQVPDARTARILPLVLREHADPTVTLIKTTGRFGQCGVFEIPFGITVREFAFGWAGGIPSEGTMTLGGRTLARSEWDLPLTYDVWGESLGWGVLDCR